MEPAGHVAIVPTPGLGHLIPLTELAKRLVVHHNFAVTFFIPNDGTNLTPQKKVLQALPKVVSSTFLPPVNFDDLPPDAVMETKIALTLSRSLPAIRDSVKALAESTMVKALVVDLFGLEAFEVANEFNVLPYLFFPTTAMLLWFAFELPKLDETTTCEYRDLPEPVRLPGCVPLHGRDFSEPVQDRSDDAYKALVGICKRFKSAAGIMVNSFADLEPGAFKAFKEQGPGLGLPPVYPVGPVIQTGSAAELGENECLSWLDAQPKRSVLYVSFGSGGTLTSKQMNELAAGIEMSRVRFLWVARSPNEKLKNATYFGAQGPNDPLSFLPQGFLERTKDVGKVVSSWAPQVQILSHESTGGFLTHCGWNSTLESIVNGVPLIAWPLYAEQKTNAVLLAEGIKVAWRVKVNDKGIVEREEICKYAKGLIEGDEGKVLRKKMMELKKASQLALSPDGSSTKSLSEVANMWKEHKN
ncbi:PREDICTED: hydroquinone glucosyltransferase-like [Fragaria vesca subsp. vesca]|uniref:hydroquinone glucosyltransferase-like n=1 Tax=Fragaria vesca subsp. vesca TaxID=101020 RepID=UPI0002C2F5F4|nr:PREDICTED: hydroquinone glucosyltransferase-like [Fragaria vesca subsp. vesca]